MIDLDAVVVSGVQPGPGLWRVTKGDHVLYILGTQSPLPRDMAWDAHEVRQVLAEAGAVLGSPGVSVNAEIGFFRGLTLAPSALKAMKNPGGAMTNCCLRTCTRAGQRSSSATWAGTAAWRRSGR